MVNARAAVFYASDLVPCLNSELEEILGSGQWVAVDENDEMVVNFYYSFSIGDRFFKWMGYFGMAKASNHRAV